ALNSVWRVFIVLQSRLQLQIHQRQSKIATPINGLSAANQKEMFQSEFSGVGFLFTTFSQAFEKRHFRKFEIFLLMRGRSTYDYCSVIDISLRRRLECNLREKQASRQSSQSAL